MWPNETNGVISCSGTSAFRLLLSGYKNKTVKITSLFYRYLDIVQNTVCSRVLLNLLCPPKICSKETIKSNFSHIRHLILISPTEI